MSTILTLNKRGVPYKTEVRESVDEIWQYMMGISDVNAYGERHECRDFICLTDPKGQKVIITKKLIWKIENGD